MASQEFRELEREARRFRKELLPKAFDPLGIYPRSVQTHTRAFLILSHAAVETYLEGRAKRIARRAEEVWKKDGKITRPMAFLVGYYDGGIESPINRKCPDFQMTELAKDVFLKYYKIIKDNHGVKTDSVYAIFSRLGVNHVSFGTVLLPELDSFGTDRGGHAHHSAKAVEVLDPEIEWKRVERILTELEAFDSVILKYLSGIR
ncbi:MAG: hypothetical protein EOP84_05415 [Verrucomicrobiaceae bacterium]|nr:MAG: hypothetical protein EOP84_05415 [Verrucomicrobiaceae bacterium]